MAVGELLKSREAQTYLEKRSAMALFLPRVETIDSSLAVTLSDWDAHCLRLNGATEAIFCARAIDLSCRLVRREDTGKKEMRTKLEQVLLTLEEHPSCVSECSSHRLTNIILTPTSQNRLQITRPSFCHPEINTLIQTTHLTVSALQHEPARCAPESESQ